jgi:cytochrome P450
MSSVDAGSATGPAPGPFDLLLDPAFSANPQPIYRELRDRCPVARQDVGLFGDGAMVMLYRHDDVVAALRNPEKFSSNFGTGMAGLGNDRPLIPLQIDPPHHKKYRVLLDPLFAPQKMDALEGPVTELVNDLIGGFIDRGECEFNNDFAVPLPCIVFLRLLGLPVEDLDLFLRLKDDIIRGGGELDLEKQGEVRAAAGREFYEYFGAVLDDRERSRQDDMLSRFLDAEVDGERLTREEILDIGFLFLIAGLDTVTDSLTCFFHTLANRPDLRERLVDEPAIIPAAVEELLRWETPVPGVARVATGDIEIGGCPVRAGDSVMLSLGSANTDDAAFDRADEIDFDRAENRHWAFGGGIHRCLGSHLARRELRVALREWHRRIPSYHIPEGATLQWAPMLRQVEHLPLVFDEVSS